MKLYNTLTRKVEEFNPLNDKQVLFYQCGPTVYWVQHIGNLRAMVWADLIRRTFEYLGYQVIFVRNYTDVGHLVSDADEGEDKMEKAAKREKLTPQLIAQKYINIFENDTTLLNIKEPTYKPKATEYIPEMIKMIEKLLFEKKAYITNLAIYFDVTQFKDYTQLSRQKPNLQLPNAGKGRVADPEKKHFYDFALWFFKKGEHKNALQTWPSPWGEGFPGWHIECSVMSIKLLGETIDIHMGGVEHIPIHHTNEIAQSESYTGKKFVNYWLHNEHLLVNNQKMSKSEGNILTLNDVVKKGYDPLDLRYFYLQAHYRSRQNFTFEALSASRQARLRLINKIKSLLANKIKPVSKLTNSHGIEYQNKFIEYISNDFSIPEALSLAWEMIDNKNIPEAEKYSLLLKFDQIFGLKLSEITLDVIPNEIIQLAEARQKARKEKNYQKADQLRRKIESRGYLIEDTEIGYKIKSK